MCAGSSESAGRRKKKAAKDVDRPFAVEVLASAKRFVQSYRLVLEPDEELGFVGHALELPTVFADGSTPNKCVKATYEALTGAVATMSEQGDSPPAPATEGERPVQLNIRLTIEEKALLEEKARQGGYRTISDYVRAAALRFYEKR